MWTSFNITLCIHLTLLVAVIETWAKGSLPAAHVNIRSNSLRTTLFSATPIQISGYPKRRSKQVNGNKINIRIRSSPRQNFVTNFVFFQFSSPRPWYVKFLEYRAVENEMDCAKFLVSSRKGNRIVLKAHWYNIRWVQIFNLLVNAICVCIFI
jgi:hypothetical protein